MQLIKNLIMLMLLIYVNINYSATTTELLLQNIDNNTAELSTKTTSFWTSYLTNYLKINTPATNTISSSLFSELKVQSELMDNSVSNDIQAVINSSLNNNLNMNDFITPPGLFANISPIGSTENSSLNIESILSKTAITGLSRENNALESISPESRVAKNFILLLMGAANPPQVETTQGDMSDAEYQQHLGYIWALNAQQGVALGNLYHVLRQREIRPGLGTTAELGKANASILEVEESLIAKRVGDPNWYSKMESASPLDIQRESLFVLAEIQRLLHLTRKQNERIMVSFATLISQGIDLRKALNQQADATSSAGGDTSVPDQDSLPDIELPS